MGLAVEGIHGVILPRALGAVDFGHSAALGDGGTDGDSSGGRVVDEVATAAASAGGLCFVRV